MTRRERIRRAYAIEEAERRCRREGQCAVVYRPDGKLYHLVATGPSLEAIGKPGLIVHIVRPPAPEIPPTEAEAPDTSQRPGRSKAPAASAEEWRCPACGGDVNAPNPARTGRERGRPSRCHKTRHQAEAERRRAAAG